MNETWMQTHGLMYEQHAHDIHMPSHIINNGIVMFMNILFSIHLLFAFSDQANMLMCIVNRAFAKYEILDESRSVHSRYLCLLICVFALFQLSLFVQLSRDSTFLHAISFGSQSLSILYKIPYLNFSIFCSLALHISVISLPVFVTLSRMCAWNEFNEFCKWNSWFSTRKLNVLKSTKLWF